MKRAEEERVGEKKRREWGRRRGESGGEGERERFGERGRKSKQSCVSLALPPPSALPGCVWQQYVFNDSSQVLALRANRHSYITIGAREHARLLPSQRRPLRVCVCVHILVKAHTRQV